MSQKLKERIKKIARQLISAKGKHIPEHPTWWTCFYFDGYAPTDLHCTHKYFGDLEDDQVSAVKDILDKFFENKPFKSFQVTFDKKDLFGEDKDVKVVTPTKYNKEHFLLDLRKKLDKFRKDNFPDYKPHVTTDKEMLEKPFKGYALMFGEDIVQKYEA